MTQINLDSVLSALSLPNQFPSVEEIYRQVETVSSDPRFAVSTIGNSASGKPIQLVRFGSGQHKVMLVGYPHPNEPIGGLTVLALLQLLQQGNEALLALDVEWNLIPCVDPDGAALNEGWSLQPFDFKRFMQHYYRQSGNEQTEWTFPVAVEGYQFDNPSPMTKALMQALLSIKPDFYFSLHNAMWGGAYFFISDDVGEPYYQQIKQHLHRHKIPLHLGEPEFGCVPVYQPAFYGEVSFKLIYEDLKRYYDRPQEHVSGGNSSFDFMREQGIEALTMICELPYIKHPDIENTAEIELSRRQLHVFANAQKACFLAELSALITPLEAELNHQSAFYGAYEICRDHLFKHMSQIPKPLLQDDAYRRNATVSERFDIRFAHYLLLCFTHQLVRLLQDSSKSTHLAVAEQLTTLFDAELAALQQQVDFSQFEVLQPAELAKVQLGIGLIGLEARLAR